MGAIPSSVIVAAVHSIKSIISTLTKGGGK